MTSVDRSTWTDDDWTDVTKFGICDCGLPRRHVLESRDDGIWSVLRCDAGHDAGEGW